MAYTPQSPRSIAAHALREEARFLFLLLGSDADDGGLLAHIERLLTESDRVEAEGRVGG
jgi:hypothetical protein